MHLRYYTDEKGQRVYTLKMKLDNGQYTHNAHPGNTYVIHSEVQS